MDNKKIVLIDGNSIMNRAFYGIPNLTNSKGIHTNAIYGFMNIVLKILDEEKPEYLAVAFDVHEKTFRHMMYEDYKGTRRAMPDELKEQMPLVQELLRKMQVEIFMKGGYEADDILGTLARMATEKDIKVTLVSGDRDMLQLSTEDVLIRIPKTGRGRTVIENYYPKDVFEKYSVTPKQIIDLKALMGDSSDNIPGVPGVGEKTATGLLNQFESIDDIYENIESVEKARTKKLLSENKDMCYLSYKLATIDVNAEIEVDFDDLKIKDNYNADAYAFMRELELKTLLSRFNFDLEGDEQSDSNDEYRLAMNSFEKKIIRSKKDFEKFCKTNFKEVSKLSLELIGDEWSNEYAKKKKRSKKGDGQISFNFDSEEPALDLKENRFSFEGLSVSYDKNSYIIYRDFTKGSEGIFEDDIIELLKNIISNSDKIIVPDIKNFLHLSEADEVNPLDDLIYENYSKFFDVSIAEYLINPIINAYKMADVASNELDVLVKSYKENFDKKQVKDLFEELKNFDESSTEFSTLFDSVNTYYFNNSEVAFLSEAVLSEKLKNTEMIKLYNEIEMPTAYYLYRIESVGIRADKDELKNMSVMLGESVDKLTEEIYELSGEEFNINSPKQLGVVLFEKMELPGAKKTKTGYSTAADVLDKLKDDFPIVKKILEYRQLSKLKSTYADGLAPFISEDGRIHGKFNQTITATGRISSTDPNLQNIPVRMELGRKFRGVFKPKDGYTFLDADYSQIELRLLAHMSEDEELIDSYKIGKDIHAITASKVFKVPFEEVTKEQRRNAKAVNFGIVYGISSFGLGEDLGITRAQAKEYIEQYFHTYPRIKTFLDGLVTDAKTKGYSKTIFGRRRPVPEISSKNFNERNFGERIAMNSPIQGSAADIMKIAMINVCRAIRKEGLKSRVILQVHDELLVETHPDEIEKVREILLNEMQNAASLKVSLIAEVNEGSDWNEAH
ncbi:MAG: DNA polymerase I [Lachnospiraceae bacterium]|nr:DNA polymerase I [Lachnospiraceae bacterium]